MSNLTKLTKPELIKLLETERATSATTITGLRAELADEREITDAHKQADQGNAEEIGSLKNLVAKARDAMKPFKDKITWDVWPNEQIAVIGKLTFGDLKRAKEVYQSLLC